METFLTHRVTAIEIGNAKEKSLVQNFKVVVEGVVMFEN